MTLYPRQLEILAAIVERGGLTEGAAALGKSQTSVSRRLSQLEARNRAPLFKPGHRPLQPSEPGQALADQGRVVRVGQPRVGRLMRQNGIGVTRSRTVTRASDSDHAFNIAPNLLRQDFIASGPNQARAGLGRDSPSGCPAGQ